jgi:hypothetical protein
LKVRTQVDAKQLQQPNLSYEKSDLQILVGVQGMELHQVQIQIKGTAVAYYTCLALAVYLSYCQLCLIQQLLQFHGC